MCSPPANRVLPFHLGFLAKKLEVIIDDSLVHKLPHSFYHQILLA